jgi:hypothetical protein
MDRLSNNPDYELLEEDIGTEDAGIAWPLQAESFCSLFIR